MATEAHKNHVGPDRVGKAFCRKGTRAYTNQLQPKKRRQRFMLGRYRILYELNGTQGILLKFLLPFFLGPLYMEECQDI